MNHFAHPNDILSLAEKHQTEIRGLFAIEPMPPAAPQLPWPRRLARVLDLLAEAMTPVDLRRDEGSWPALRDYPCRPPA